MMNGLIGILVFAADVWAVLNIVQSHAPTAEKALWIVLVLVLPVLGLAIWYFVGPKSATS